MKHTVFKKLFLFLFFCGQFSQPFLSYLSAMDGEGGELVEDTGQTFAKSEVDPSFSDDASETAVAELQQETAIKEAEEADGAGSQKSDGDQGPQPDQPESKTQENLLEQSAAEEGAAVLGGGSEGAPAGQPQVTPQPSPGDADADAAQGAKEMPKDQANETSDQQAAQAGEPTQDLREALKNQKAARDNVKTQQEKLKNSLSDAKKASKEFQEADGTYEQLQKKFNDSPGDKALEKELNDAKSTRDDAEKNLNDAEARLDKNKEEFNKAKTQKNQADETVRQLNNREEENDNLRKVRDRVKADKELAKSRQRAAKVNAKKAEASLNEEGISSETLKGAKARLQKEYGAENPEDLKTKLEKNYRTKNGLSEDEPIPDNEMGKIKERVENFKNDLQAETGKIRISKDGQLTDDDINDILEKKYGERDGKNEEAYDKTKENLQALKKAGDEIEKYQNEINGYNDEIKQINSDISANRWSHSGRIAKDLGYQAVIAFLFMIPGDIVGAIEQVQQIAALRNTISGPQVFGGIPMNIVSGLESYWAPLSSVFVYTDNLSNKYNYPDGSSNKNSQITVSGFYASYDQYGNIAQNYLSSGLVLEMLHFNSGTIFNGAGIVSSMLPLFKNKTAPSQNSQAPQGVASTQDALTQEYRFIAGEVHKETYNSALPYTVDSNPSGNAGVAQWFTPGSPPPGISSTGFTPQKYADGGTEVEISPLLFYALQMFRNPTTLSLFNITLQEMVGIGAMVEPIVQYNKWFGSSSTTKADLISELNNQAIDWTLPSSWTSSSKLNNLGIADQGYLSATTRLVGQGIYLYQSDTTALGQFLQTQVKKMCPVLAPYVHDYLVCLDQNSNIVPALVTQIQPSVTPAVQWVQNPNIAYVVSLVNGATFAPGGNGLPMTEPQSSTIDYDIANAAVSAVVSSYGSSVEIKQQLGAMRFFADTLISEGPYTLAKGITAQLVTGLADELESGSISNKAKNAKMLGDSAQGAKLSTSDSSLALSAKKAMLEPGGGVYIYRIDNQLQGPKQITKDGKEVTTMLPDYVVPVTPNPTTGNYLIVPLGMQAAVSSGSSLPSVSSSVTALVSIITGKFYTPQYTLFPNAITTNIYSMISPGEPAACPNDGSSPCANGYQVQKGGMDVPLATAFMETDLNPLNQYATSSSVIQMLPFYFLTIEYDYCPQGTMTSSAKNTTNIGNYFATNFMTVDQCVQSSTMKVPLYRVLPQTFTGIPWPSSVNASIKEELSATKALESVLKSATNNTSSTTASGNATSKNATGKNSPKKVVKTTSSNNVTNSASPDTWSLAQVHNAWRDACMSNEKTNWSLLLAEGPFNFTDNGGNEYDWTITADTEGISQNVYLYSVQSPNSQVPLDGLWVAAKVSSTGTTDTSTNYNSLGESLGLTPQNPGYTVVKPSDAFSLSGASSVFSNIGGVFSNGSPLNALINIGTGEILIKVEKPNGQYTVDLIAPVANAWGELYQLDPSDVLKALPTQPTDNLLLRIQMLQSASNNSSRVGPYSFGPFTMFIDREQLNSGNYIYQVFDSTLSSMDTAEVTDYLVAFNSDANGYTYGGPITPDTQSMVSIVKGIQYSRNGSEDTLWETQGVKNIILYQNLRPTLTGSTPLLGFCNTVFDALTNKTNVPISQSFKTVIQQANSNFVNGKTAAQQTQTQDDGGGYDGAVIKALSNGSSNFTFPAESELTPVPSIGSSEGVPLFTDKNGNFYIKTNQLTAAAVPGTVGYYAFNVASSSDTAVNVIPTGVYFELPDSSAKSSSTSSITKPTPVSVLFGTAARAMASAHGVSISSSGEQSMMFPVQRKALAMMSEDKALAGGKDGRIMVKVYPEAVMESAEGTTYYLYKNIANFSPVALSQPTTNGKATLAHEYAPSDILLQVNPENTQVAPYYISLITGIEYSIDGQPRSELALAYFPQKSDGSYNLLAPLVVWGSGKDMKLLIPYQSDSTTGSYSYFDEDYTETCFVEMSVSPGGLTYQYTDSTGEKIYNFTSINPATSNPDENVYLVDATNQSSPKLLKTWKPNSSSKDKTYITLMEQALIYAKNQGYIPSQRVYTMEALGYVPENFYPEGVVAKFNISKNQWSLYDNTSTPFLPIGLFINIMNPTDLSQLIIPKVTKFLGSRDVNASGQLLESSTDQSLARLVYLIDNQTASQTAGETVGVIWRGDYFKHDPIKHDYYENTPADPSQNTTANTMTFVEAISPLLYCANSTTASSSQNLCAEWPSQSRGTQLPNDISYFSVQDPNASNPVNYIYGQEFPVAGQIDLESFYSGLKLMPVTSNRGVTTIVKYLDVKGLVQLSTESVGTPAQNGKPAKDYKEYKSDILSQINKFYDSRSNITSGAAAATKAAEDNAQAQGVMVSGDPSFSCSTKPSSSDSELPKSKAPALNTKAQRPWCKQPGKPCPATPPQAATLQHICYEADKFKAEASYNAKFQTGFVEYNKSEVLGKINGIFDTIEANIKNLYYDPVNEFLVYKVTPDDYIPFINNGYVSYPFQLQEQNATNHVGGFIFDSNGVPTGGVVSIPQLQRIQGMLAQLRVVSTKPLRLDLPPIINEETLHIPAVTPPPVRAPVQNTQKSSTSLQARFSGKKRGRRNKLVAARA